MANLKKEYGEEGAKNVFYGGITKGKFTGVLPSKEEHKFRSRYKHGKKKKKKSKAVHNLRNVIHKIKSKREK